MDNQRLFLFVALSFVVLLLWQAWMKDYGPPPAETAPPSQPAVAQTPVKGGDLPGAAPEAGVEAGAPVAARLLQTTGQVVVETDLYRAVIDTTGGDLRELDLLAYRETNAPDSPPLRLMNDSLPKLFILQSGLLPPTGGESARYPTHHAVYTAQQTQYRMAEGADTLQVPLTWQGDDGVVVTKRYTFHRGSYVVDLEHEVDNRSTGEWSARQYRQLQRNELPKKGKTTFIRTYTGGVIYSPQDKYEKITFEDMQKQDLDRTITDGWAAMLQHYFLGALIPDRDAPQHYYTKALGGGRYVIGLTSSQHRVAAGEHTVFSTRLFLGPKLQDEMKQVVTGLELTVDYGRLTVLAQPLFWLLKSIHNLIGNWGWAIVLLTLLIKLAFFKLSETSYRSMANMRRLAPRLQSLKERYSDDRQKLNQAMMELYKKEKINPLGGCLPILVQIPVFISLYWVLLEAVELRQAPFMLWIKDMSSQDPYYILPLLMGATMLIQQKLNPAPMDPIQAKVMMVLPVVFTVFFAFFPSGLVLYWVVNNTLSIAQQWTITRRIERGSK